MTTYELPPEPPVGSRVRDHHGHVWTHTNDGWSHPELTSSGLSWGAVMAYASPAELIEPDPWPTEPLIVADMGDDRELFSRNFEGAYESRTYYVDSDTDSPLTNVVPVTVVPTERVDHLSAAHASWVAGAIEDKTMIGYAIGLLESLDELGLDQ